MRWFALTTLALALFLVGGRPAPAQKIDAAQEKLLAQVKKLGGRFFVDPKTKRLIVDLERADVGDKELATLAGLTAVANLNLNSTRVTGAGLEHLKKMAN
ncbi:MAG: hypothetical protein AB7K24_07150, partial [Gemmataceae bacterium]